MRTPQLPRVTQPKSAIALSVKISAILFATLAIFHQDIIILANEALQSELMTHILAIPFLLTYLIYRKRKMLRAAIPFETSIPTRKPTYTREIVGALLCLTAFLLYWHGSYTFTPLEHHMLSLPIFITGLILIIFNTQALRALAFPITFLLFLVPPPLEIIYTLGNNLSTISSQAAHTLLKAIGLPVSLTEQYGTPVIILQKPESPPLTFAIDIACAGIYSLIGFAIFAIFVAYIAKGKPWKKAAIFLFGFPLIYILNIIRITIIVLLGHQYGVELAMQAFHLLGGWVLIFLGTLILLTISEKILKTQLFITKPKPTSCNHCNQNPNTKQHFCPACGKVLNPMNIKISKQDLSKICILTICAILILNLQVPVFALTEGPAEVTIQTLGGEQTITQILPEVSDYTTKFIYRDRRFEEIAKQDASLAYSYTPTTNKSKENIWITIEIAKTRSSLHRWEVCLVTWPQEHGYQPGVTQLDLQDVQLLENPPITARYFAFQQKQTNQTQVVLYWYENARFQTNTTSQQEYVKISLIAFPKNPTNIQQTEQKLLPFAKAIVTHWQPIKTWSQIALTISQNGPALIALTTTVLTTLLAFQAIRNHQCKKSNQKAYQKLTLQDQQILKTIYRTKKQHEPATTMNIATTYRKLTKNPIPLETLHQKLMQAEEVGLVEMVITSREDVPILIWRSLIIN